MSTYDQFLEARALSEALLLQHALEGTTSSEQFVVARNVDRTFSKLASKLGYRVERLPAPSSTTGEAA